MDSYALLGATFISFLFFIAQPAPLGKRRLNFQFLARISPKAIFFFLPVGRQVRLF